MADVEADEYYFQKFLANQSSLWQRLTQRLKREISVILEARTGR